MPEPSARRAFTLVELLVVLGIMIALAGLLFPVFTRAHESAKRVRCVNNVRQLTQAWLAYAGDNERILCRAWTGPLPQPIQSGKLWPYIKNLAPYRCPDERTESLVSYSINGVLAGPVGAPFPLRRLDDITQPSRTFVFIEQASPNIGGGGGFFDTPIYPQFYLSLGGWPGENHHGSKAYAEGTGISFADGHAIFWEYTDARTGNLVESTWGGLNGQPVIDATGKKTYPSAYNPNSPDVYQLEAWSGGPVPPDIRPLEDPLHPGSS
jgi:type II secretory pathway pseudopilin PulG